MTIYDHSMPTAMLVIAVAVAILLGAFSFWRFVPKNRVTVFLPALYLITLGLLVWCLLMPGRKDAITHLLKPRFVVMLDTSASMALTPKEGVPTRIAVARQALDLPWTALVGSECEIDIIPFSDQPGDKLLLSDAAELTPEGSSTHLRDSLKLISDRYTGLNVAGALLLSDGHDTREAYDDWAGSGLPFPVHTLRLQGDELWQEDADLRIDSMNTPRRVTVDWTTELKVKIAGQGTQGKQTMVQLFRNDVLLTEKPAQIPTEGGEQEIVFELEHNAVGLFNYRAEVTPLAGEVNTDDNSYQVNVQVSDAKNRLLYVEGIPRWEFKFLKRTLLDNQQLSPTIFYTGSDGKPRGATQVGRMTADMTESELAYFKIVVLGNLDAEELTETRAQNLVKFVDNGGSLVILGGSKSWSDEGFPATALKAILPVRSKGATTLEGANPFPVRLTDTARSHPAFAGDPELWSDIPPVLSLFQGVTPAPAAQVLVTATTAKGSEPLVVSQRYGQGKVAAIFTDSLWKWQLSPESSVNKPYPRFWTQLISWMLPKETQVEVGKVEISADRDRLFLGEQVELNARVGSPESGTMRSIITTPDGSDVPYAMSPGEAGTDFSSYIFRYTAKVPGLYKVQAEWDAGGLTKKSDPLSFFVESFSPESVPKPINHRVLQTIATASGGTFHETLNDLDRALSSMNTRAIEEESAEFNTLWRTPLMITLLMLVLSTSWLIRKLKNMP